MLFFGPAAAAVRFSHRGKIPELLCLWIVPKKRFVHISPRRERERESKATLREKAEYSYNPKIHALPFQRKSSKEITPHHLPHSHHTVISASSGPARPLIYIISHTNMMPKFHPPSIRISRSASNGAIIPRSNKPLLLLLPFTHTCQGIKRQRPGRGRNTRTPKPASGPRGARRVHHFPWFLL